MAIMYTNLITQYYYWMIQKAWTKLSKFIGNIFDGQIVNILISDVSSHRGPRVNLIYQNKIDQIRV